MSQKQFTVDTTGDLTNQCIQAAIDEAAAAGGGTVNVPAGEYQLHDAVHMKDNVKLIGEGEGKTVLIKVPSVSSNLSQVMGYGHYEFAVDEPGKFKVGDGIHLIDDNAGGFYTTVATISDIDDEWFFINRPATHDFHPNANARAITAFALIEIETVENATVENIVLDGNTEETFRLNGCRGGGIFAIGSSNLTFTKVEIRNYNGDALSFQQCADVRVSNCDIHHCTGHGLHPGSGSVRYTFIDNYVHHNEIDGLFYCLRTTHSLTQGNRIENNGRHGISIGERDTNHHIRQNTIIGNQEHGIEFRPVNRQSGDDVIVENNDIGPNTRDGKSENEIHIPKGLKRIHICDNRIEVARGKAMYVEAGCEQISFVGNEVDGKSQSNKAVADEAGVVQYAAPDDLPSVGPLSLPLHGAKHLFRKDLLPWRGESDHVS